MSESRRKNIKRLCNLMVQFGIKHIILCPGMRNVPLIQAFESEKQFTIHSVTDERSAGFYALGIALRTGTPAAVCCTSGTAVLNLYSSVAEAFYQKIPLLVISADRPKEWIGQRDGQTVPQENVFGDMVKKSISLIEEHNDEERWYNNRIINEALTSMTLSRSGPAHINISLSEPLFETIDSSFAIDERKINLTRTINTNISIASNLEKEWKECRRPMLIIGQSSQSMLDESTIQLLAENKITIVCENLSNINYTGNLIRNIDNLLFACDEISKLQPDLLIYAGNHIVSKRLKQYFRKNKVPQQWLITDTEEMPDLFCSLTDVIVDDRPEQIIKYLANNSNKKDAVFYDLWNKKSDELSSRASSFKDDRFSDLMIIKLLFERLENADIHLGNSSVIRLSQMFDLPKNCSWYCNRGTSGIDGTLSTAVGFDSIPSARKTLCIIGDLSFFYDMNALWNKSMSKNFRVLLINNGNGQIFRTLPDFPQATESEKYIVAEHKTSARGWTESLGIQYLSADNRETFHDLLDEFLSDESDGPILFEAFTDKEIDLSTYQSFFNYLKNK